MGCNSWCTLITMSPTVALICMWPADLEQPSRTVGQGQVACSVSVVVDDAGCTNVAGSRTPVCFPQSTVRSDEENTIETSVEIAQEAKI